MNKFIKLTVIYLFSFLFIIFGSNKFLGFLNLPLPDDPSAKTFLITMFSTYLVKLVGFTQVAGAILLLFYKTRFIGVLMFVPVIINILVFHLAHDNPGNGLWIFVSVLFLSVCYSQKDGFKALFKIQDIKKSELSV